MYNVIINSTCNLSCSYCFADDYMSSGVKSSDHDMDTATFIDILHFLKKSNVDHVSLLGGEPTLHPKFREFWMLAKTHQIPFSLKSNALWSEDLLKFFNDNNDDIFAFHLNINHPSKLTAKQWESIKHNVKNLNSKYVRVQLNIDNPQFEFQWLLDLASETGITEIYWSLAAPIASPDKPSNSFAAQSEHRNAYGPRLEEFLSKAHDMGMTTTGIHGPTPCLISEELNNKLKTRGSELDGQCLPVFDIFPDRKVHYCFPLKDMLSTPTIDDVDSLEKIAISFIKETMVLRSLSFPFQDCVACPEALSGNCHGGCLSQKKFATHDLNDGWKFFDQSVPVLSENVYVADDFLLYKGKPQSEKSDIINILKQVDGSVEISKIYDDYVTKSKSSVGLRDKFATLIAEAVWKKFIVLRPQNKKDINLR